MTTHRQELLDRLMSRAAEDNSIERKPQSVKAHELRQTLVAFSNSLDERQMGILFIGVDDKAGAILGVDEPDKLQKRVGEAGEECYPPIRPAMTVLDVEEKKVLAVEISHSRNKPHFAGPAYVRSGARSVKASEELYRDLLTSHSSKAGELLRWKGKYVTVRTLHKRLGNHHPTFEAGVHRLGTARVIEVDPFTATFHFTQYSDEKCTEPLSSIELDWDSIEDRRMVIVQGTPT